MKIETARSFYIYILTNHSKQLFETGVTGDLSLRLNFAQTELTSNSNPGKCVYLIYWELCENPLQALHREKQIKSYTRKKKAELIATTNPEWKFLNEEIAIH